MKKLKFLKAMAKLAINPRKTITDKVIEIIDDKLSKHKGELKDELITEIKKTSNKRKSKKIIK